MRHTLNDESVHAATLVGSWAAFPGLIPHDDVIQTFNNKSKRPKGKARIEELADDIEEIVLN
jgi:hypothetical protein